MEVKENPKLLYSFGFFVYICIVLIKRVFMFEWFRNIFDKYKYHHIKYIIYDGEVTIIGVKYLAPDNVSIPRTIKGYPVTVILLNSFPYGSPRTKINNIKIENGFCIIHNKWFYYHYWSTVHVIKYQIGSDYQFDGYHFINNVLYSFHFK